MLDRLIEQLEHHLSEEGVILDVLMRTEQSLLAAEETHELELLFATSEEAVEQGKPAAAIHVFPLQQGVYELEGEVTYLGAAGMEWNPQRLLEAGQQIIPEMTLTVEQRFLSPGVCSEQRAILAYHFVLEVPVDEDDERYHAMLASWAKDMGRLLRL